MFKHTNIYKYIINVKKKDKQNSLVAVAVAVAGLAAAPALARIYFSAPNDL
jgi:hypothetical protein